MSVGGAEYSGGRGLLVQWVGLSRESANKMLPEAGIKGIWVLPEP